MSDFRIGLTGGLASGKSTVAALFAKHGAAVVDADAVSRRLTAAGGDALPALREIFGDWAFAADGGLNRAEMRRRVFADAALRKKLEGILHPRIGEEMRARLRAAESPYAVGVVPLLFESGGWAEFFHRVAVVDCAPAAQRRRARARDSAGDAAAIIAAQMPAEERRRRADDIISNDGDEAALAAAVAAMHARYLQSATIFAEARAASSP